MKIGDIVKYENYYWEIVEFDNDLDCAKIKNSETEEEKTVGIENLE